MVRIQVTEKSNLLTVVFLRIVLIAVMIAQFETVSCAAIRFQDITRAHLRDCPSEDLGCRLLFSSRILVRRKRLRHRPRRLHLRPRDQVGPKHARWQNRGGF